MRILNLQVQWKHPPPARLMRRIWDNTQLVACPISHNGKENAYVMTVIVATCNEHITAQTTILLPVTLDRLTANINTQIRLRKECSEFQNELVNALTKSQTPCYQDEGKAMDYRGSWTFVGRYQKVSQWGTSSIHRASSIWRENIDQYFGLLTSLLLTNGTMYLQLSV